jgi:hypothetical protein
LVGYSVKAAVQLTGYTVDTFDTTAKTSFTAAVASMMGSGVSAVDVQIVSVTAARRRRLLRELLGVSSGVVVTFKVNSADSTAAASTHDALLAMKAAPDSFVANLRTELSAAGATAPVGLEASVLTVAPVVAVYDTVAVAEQPVGQAGGAEKDEYGDVVIILGVLSALLGLVVLVLTYSYCHLWKRISEQDKMLDEVMGREQNAAENEEFVVLNAGMHAARQAALEQLLEEDQVSVDLLSPPTASAPNGAAGLLSPPTAVSQTNARSLSAMPPVLDGELSSALHDYQDGETGTQGGAPSQEPRYHEGQIATLRDDQAMLTKGVAGPGPWVMGPGQAVPNRHVHTTPGGTVAGFILDLASPPPASSSVQV